jgi:hypothetical protein
MDLVIMGPQGRKMSHGFNFVTFIVIKVHGDHAPVEA